MGEKLAKFNAVGFSVGVVIALTTFFLFAIGGILYVYWGNASAIKDALSIAASFFGGFATLVAAIIAAYLYTDWREPHFLSKVKSDQNDIIAVTRRMKRNIDTFNLIMNTRRSTSPALNNGDEFSLKYQKIVYDLLDDIDDLVGLVKAYNFNFQEDTRDEKEHLDKIDLIEKSLLSIHQAFSSPNPVDNYIESYRKMRNLNSDEMTEHYRNVLHTLPDTLSEYYSTLIKRN